MNKRVLDGGGLWKSDKLARIEPPRYRAEYANWIPLALANGVFEGDTRRIWAIIYSYNRPDISVDDAEKIKRELCRVGLLFLWPDEETGKIWAYFVGIDKPGRLPSRSRLDKKHEPIGPIPPAGALRSYVELTRSKPLESSMVGQWLANGCLGFGIGIGLGTGKGEDKKTSAAKPMPPPDPRFQEFFSFAYESYRAKHIRAPIWIGKDRQNLKALLREHSSDALPLALLKARWHHFTASTEAFTSKQADSLAYFCTHIDQFADGPILAPQKGTTNGNIPAIPAQPGKYDGLPVEKLTN